jgi:hypothetical protein
MSIDIIKLLYSSADGGVVVYSSAELVHEMGGLVYSSAELVH